MTAIQPLRFVIFEVAIREVIIRLGAREGVRRESLVDIPYLSFRKFVREYFEVKSLDVQCREGICYLRAEK